MNILVSRAKNVVDEVIGQPFSNAGFERLRCQCQLFKSTTRGKPGLKKQSTNLEAGTPQIRVLKNHSQKKWYSFNWNTRHPGIQGNVFFHFCHQTVRLSSLRSRGTISIFLTSSMSRSP